MRTRNPVFTRDDTFSRVPTPSAAELQTMYAAPPATATQMRRMTLDDVVVKTAGLLVLLLITGAVAWSLDWSGGVALGAAVVGFVLALVVIFKRRTSPALIAAYALVEGVFLGAISHAFNTRYPGIVIEAVLGTLCCFAGVLAAYRARWVRATPRFTRIILAAMIGLVGLMLLNLVVSLFGGTLGIRDGGGIAIVFSIVAIVVASLSFVLDFDAIEGAIANGAPERESWMAAFGLVVGLVWLYTEVLRLLGYMRN
ncbi:MAG: Bax inhibitor-1/YccA family protein [Frankiaceae bacterium]